MGGNAKAKAAKPRAKARNGAVVVGKGKGKPQWWLVCPLNLQNRKVNSPTCLHFLIIYIEARCERSDRGGRG